jgi:hypothetical protein
MARKHALVAAFTLRHLDRFGALRAVQHRHDHG